MSVERYNDQRVVKFIYCTLIAAACSIGLLGTAVGAQQNSPAAASSYLLGYGDQLSIHVAEADEVPDKPFRIDEKGTIDLPMAGAVQAAGLTIHEFQTLLVKKFSVYIQRPQVTVFVTEMRSQPVSVLGAVNSPGVHQLQGHKTLIEMLSMAGGLRTDAGYRVKITRRLEWGQLPIAGSRIDEASETSVAEIALKGLMEADNPADNISVMPNDVLTVPAAEMIYVIGDVKKSGGFVLGQRRQVSVLQALAMAEGLSQMAKASDARILRPQAGTEARAEIAIDLKKVMAGRATDISMQANDILFIPTNGAKRLRERTLDALFAAGSGLAIYRP